MFLVDDERSDRLDIPHSCGVDDIPIIVQDKGFTPDRELDETAPDRRALIGDTIIVNGIAQPCLPVDCERIRLRLLNGSTNRAFKFDVDNDSEFDMIAGDGGFLPATARLRRIELPLGERAEIIVTIHPGRPRTLRSDLFPDDNGVPQVTGTHDFGLDEGFEILLPQPD